jgi:uncharacterized protein YbjT (DUF2867 family)
VAKAVIAIAGCSGLIGSALAAAQRAADHPVLRIVRRTSANSDEWHWNPESGEFDSDALCDVDAVVKLLRAMGLRNATVTRVTRVAGCGTSRQPGRGKAQAPGNSACRAYRTKGLR